MNITLVRGSGNCVGKEYESGFNFDPDQKVKLIFEQLELFALVRGGVMCHL